MLSIYFDRVMYFWDSFLSSFAFTNNNHLRACTPLTIHNTVQVLWLNFSCTRCVSAELWLRNILIFMWHDTMIQLKRPMWAAVSDATATRLRLPPFCTLNESTMTISNGNARLNYGITYLKRGPFSSTSINTTAYGLSNSRLRPIGLFVSKLVFKRR